MRKLLLSTLLLMILTLSQCGIQTFEPIIELNPPLALTAELLTDQYPNRIQLQFWGLNNEEYFSGYNVYVADGPTETELAAAEVYPNPSGDEDKPTVETPPVWEATLYTVILEKEYDYTELENDEYYYFYVKSYSQEYNLTSDRSNYTNFHYFK